MDMLELLEMDAIIEVNDKGRYVAHRNPPLLRPAVLIPGSFAPAHRGHWALAQAAERILRKPVAFELSMVNVDKPDLTLAELRERMPPFRNKASLWLTRAATFRDKAALFPGTVFVVGADTAQRLVDLAYHGDSAKTMLEALDEIRSRKCRFLVGGRVNAAGQFVGLADLGVPADFSDLFGEIPAERFRIDLSSTELRQRR